MKTKEVQENPVVKVGVSRQVVIPKKLYDSLGIAPGDFIEFQRSKRGEIIMKPKRLVDIDAEIEKRLALAEEDVKAGRLIGPFDTAEEAVDYLHSQLPKE